MVIDASTARIVTRTAIGRPVSCLAVSQDGTHCLYVGDYGDPSPRCRCGQPDWNCAPRPDVPSRGRSVLAAVQRDRDRLAGDHRHRKVPRSPRPRPT